MIEVAGEGLRLSGATITQAIDHENETLDTRVEGFDILAPDSLNSAKGILSEAYVQVGSCEVDGLHITLYELTWSSLT